MPATTKTDSLVINTVGPSNFEICVGDVTAQLNYLEHMKVSSRAKINKKHIEPLNIQASKKQRSTFNSSKQSGNGRPSDDLFKTKTDSMLFPAKRKRSRKKKVKNYGTPNYKHV